VLADQCLLTLGGSAALFAAALARFGIPVALFSKVGHDAIGAILIDLLLKRGVDVSGIKRDPRSRTGITTALSYAGDRALVTCLGAIQELTPRDVNLARLRRYAHLHMTSPFLQAGLRRHYPSLLRKAREAGLTTSFDPGWDPSEKWDIERCLPWTNVLMVNEIEAASLAHIRRPEDAGRSLARRVERVVVKCGPQGALTVSNGKVHRARSYPVRTVDTTGAGDAFDAGFLSAIVTGKPIEEALAFGCACGALSTRQPGGYDAQPTRREALRLMKI
jgi:sugar/nucleoside kinase (ribokinase family)